MLVAQGAALTATPRFRRRPRGGGAEPIRPLGPCIVPRDAAESYDQFGSFGLFESEFRLTGHEHRAGRPGPRCAECLDVWLPADEERWHCHVVDDGPNDKLVFYCPECAEHEFGGA